MIYKVFQDWKKLGLQFNEVTRMLREAAKVVDKHNENAENITTQLTVKPVTNGHFEVVWSYRNTGKRPSGIVETSISWDARIGSASAGGTEAAPDVDIFAKSNSVRIRGNGFEQEIGLNVSDVTSSSNSLEKGPLVFKFEQVQPGEVVSVSFLLFQFQIMGHPSNTVANEVPAVGASTQVRFVPGASVRVIATGTSPPHTLQQSARAKPWQRY